MFLAHGYQEQIVAIVPSRDAAVVRLGWTPIGRRFHANKYFSAIFAALDGAGAFDADRGK
jgi:hypothetical protein